MRRSVRRGIRRLFLVAMTLAAGMSWAADFDAVIRSVDIQRPNNTSQELTGAIYGATINATITDADQDNANFSGGDTMRLVLTDRSGRALTFDGNKAQFDQFVRDNAPAITKMLFPSGIGTAVNGIDDSQAIAVNSFDNLVAPTLSPHDHALTSGLVDKLVPLQETGMSINFEKFKVDGVTGKSVKLYPHHAFHTGKVSVNLTLPLKYTMLDDFIGTDAFNFGMEVDGSIPLHLEKKRAAYVSLGLFGNGLVFTSDAMDVGGFLRYGAVAGLSGKAVVRPVVIRGGVSYTASQFRIPGSTNSGQFDALLSALADRPLDQQLTYGASIGVPFSVRYVLNLRVAQTATIGASAISPDKQKFTLANLAVGIYVSPNVAVNVGYEQIFGARDLDAKSGLLLSSFSF